MVPKMEKIRISIDVMLVVLGDAIVIMVRTVNLVVSVELLQVVGDIVELCLHSPIDLVEVCFVILDVD